MTNNIPKTRFQLLDFNENPNVGIYCKANDTVAFLQSKLLDKIKQKISSALDVSLVEISIYDSTIIGSLIALNSTGAIVTNIANSSTISLIEQQGLSVHVLKDVINAAGNDILVNDYGALIHPDIKQSSVKKIEKVLKVPVYKGTIAELQTVGMAAAVTNKGCMCHPKISDEEKENLQKIFQVKPMIGTVNHGHPMIGSGLVANSQGAIIGNQTTGIELGRIEEALGFL